MKKEKIFLIDAHSFCYRAFYALPQLATSKGMPTGAIYGFISFILRILKDEVPNYLAICFDSSRRTFRTEKFSDYKINRPQMPDELKGQLSKIKELISALNLTSFEYEGYEADDIIATLAKKLSDDGLDVFIVTGDKDMYQLVDKNIKIYSAGKPAQIFDAKKIEEKFGIKPKQIVDFLALAGDASDNIPGAKGIGEKTATKLIKGFNSVDNLLKNLESLSSLSERKKIEDNRENIFMSRELVKLHFEVPIKIKKEDLKVKQPDNDRLLSLFKELEFKSLLKGLDTSSQMQDSSKREDCAEIEVFLEDVRKIKELLLYCDKKEDIYLGSSRYIYHLKKADDRLREVLADKNIKKISDGLKKIKVTLLKDGIDLNGLYLDFSLAFYLIDSGRSDYSLASLSLDYLEKIVDNEYLSPKEAFSLMDELKFVEKELEKRGLKELFFEIEMPLLEVLADLELTGVKIDKEFLENLSIKLEKKINSLKHEIINLAGREFNINSPKQLSQVLFEELKLPIKKRRKSHASTDEEVLRYLAVEYPICQRILEFRQLTKLKTTYIDVLPTLIDKNDKIHTSFNQTVTQTGRLSSSNPNLQNIPIKTDIGSQIRRAFIPSFKNGLLLSADYSQIELRILAHLSEEKNLIVAFKENLDIHSYTASLIFSIDKNEVDDIKRDIAKRVNFGIIYGISPFGLAKDLSIPVEEANEFIDNYFLRYPKVKEFMNSSIESCRKDGFVSTLMGRRRYLPAINSKNMQMRSFAERQAINMPVQGSAADLIKKAMLDIYQEFKDKNFISKMVLQVHDELVFDCAKEELEKIIPIIKDKMENAFKLIVPIRVEIRKGKNWLEMEEI
ncbi:MAG: DNA polymerase I [Candidatus Omnitrophota bacterium]